MNTLPKEITADEGYDLPAMGMAPGLAIMFNDRLFDRCKQIAGYMAKAEGFTPPHLIGKSEACFAVVTRALTWRLDPFAVMQSTYQTPGGKIGYEGKLVQAILENSGRLEGPVTYELFGDWEKIRGRHKKAQGQRGVEYFVPDWKPEDEVGLGVIVRAQVKGEQQPRELEFYLASAWPRNSTLWALRPDQQIKYTACRAFGNTVAPGILMGVPFDSDGDQGMIDVTPARPRRSDFEPETRAPERASETTALTSQDEAPAVSEAGAEPAARDEPAAEPVEESAADAYGIGQDARRKGAKKGQFPARFKDAPHLVEAWVAGWENKDEEIKADTGKKT